MTSRPGSKLKLTARLDGRQEAPLASTPGMGTFGASVDLEQERIFYRLSYVRLRGHPSAARIRFTKGDAGDGLVAFLCGGGEQAPCPQKGTLEGVIERDDIVALSRRETEQGLFAEAVSAMRRGETYVSVLTDAFPSGEISGKIHPVPPG